MPLQATSGAASYDAFGGGVPVAVNYIEDVFSTYLYTGNDAVRSITNGIDLAGKGGLVWFKARNQSSFHVAFDTNRGVNQYIFPNQTDAQNSYGAINDLLTSFNADGFSLGADGLGGINGTGDTMVSWTFRKQPKFFDIQTWTGNGDVITVNHNLGSAPGCIIIKAVSSSPAVGQNWLVYHRSVVNQGRLNETSAFIYSGIGNVTSTSFDPSGSGSGYNVLDVTYVAYLFAHNAGGFGLTGTDNVISCGSFTTDGSGNATVNLGYEPQWLLTKQSSGAGGQDWYLVDTMRPWANNSGYEDVALRPNLSNADYAGDYGFPTATGFYQTGLNASATHIYIAIRRGPMKVPTVGTSVFAPITATASTGTSRTVGFPADMTLSTIRTISDQRLMVDRLRGYANTNSATPPTLDTTSTAAEVVNQSATVYNVWNTTALDGPYSNTYSTIWWHFRRAPSFMDVVCYTGTGTAGTVTHNLQAVPQLIICKRRTTNGYEWLTYCAFLNGGVTPQNWWIRINSSSQQFDSNAYWNDTSPTASVFSVGVESDVNTNGASYVAYLFATCAGVSKVGGYTGNGSTQTIDCGFTAGARFVLIKRTDAAGDWMISDSARGIVSGNDPYLELNNQNAEVTGEDWLDTDSTGFVVNEVSGSNANTSSATYIFLAIA
jgi:hypothetical protein